MVSEELSSHPRKPKIKSERTTWVWTGYIIIFCVCNLKIHFSSYDAWDNYNKEHTLENNDYTYHPPHCPLFLNDFIPNTIIVRTPPLLKSTIVSAVLLLDLSKAFNPDGYFLKFVLWHVWQIFCSSSLPVLLGSPDGHFWIFTYFIVFFFWLCLWQTRVPGQGSNPRHGSDSGHCNDNTISCTSYFKYYWHSILGSILYSFCMLSRGLLFQPPPSFSFTSWHRRQNKYLCEMAFVNFP